MVTAPRLHPSTVPLLLGFLFLTWVFWVAKRCTNKSSSYCLKRFRHEFEGIMPVGLLNLQVQKLVLLWAHVPGVCLTLAGAAPSEGAGVLKGIGGASSYLLLHIWRRRCTNFALVFSFYGTISLSLLRREQLWLSPIPLFCMHHLLVS
jgi:hypothetical protein